MLFGVVGYPHKIAFRACTGFLGNLATTGLARWTPPFVNRRRGFTDWLTVRTECFCAGTGADGTRPFAF